VRDRVNICYILVVFARLCSPCSKFAGLSLSLRPSLGLERFSIMASAGAPVLPIMPDFSDHNNPFSTAGDMRFHLQNLLDSKEKQLQQAGTLGQRVLAQQMELEERIRQLQEIEADKLEDDEIDEDARERYRELAETILSWDSENAQLSSAFGGSSKVRAFLPHATNKRVLTALCNQRFTNGKAPSPLLSYAELPREEPERSKASASTSAAQSRRAKNAAHRADDVGALALPLRTIANSLCLLQNLLLKLAADYSQKFADYRVSLANATKLSRI
jgi:hypothetical protein